MLIVGAGGGVGSFAVQLAKALGAEVTGVCSAAKIEFVHALGADEVVDYAREDVTTLPARYDLIVQLAGDRSLLALRRLLGQGGGSFSPAAAPVAMAPSEYWGRWAGSSSRSCSPISPTGPSSCSSPTLAVSTWRRWSGSWNVAS